MVHKKLPDVNPRFFLWRDQHDLLHVSTTNESRARTQCGVDTDNLRYAGRLDAPTCLVCITTP